MSIKEFGLIGLGVMGKSLSRNLARRGFHLALFNRHVPGKEEDVARDFVRSFPELSDAAGFDELGAFVDALERPRKIFLMVNAGAATETVITQLMPLLAAGDIVIDGGNANYKDTDRRISAAQTMGIHWIGCGVSGGEEGALKGPSIMPGGSTEAYAMVQPYLEAIAARDRNGGSCCAYIGSGGSGHFVKMVHNGIEYAEMQLIAEVYFVLRKAGGKSPDEIADLFESWLNTDATSYLLEITVDILRVRTGEGWLIDQIQDAASNKGTGGWATIAAAELGVPATMISEALFARYLSSFVLERKVAHAMQASKPENTALAIDEEALRRAMQLARIVNHQQGIHLISAAAKAYQWTIDLPELARIWTNGCIIRSYLMEQLRDTLSYTEHILLAPEWLDQAQKNRPDLTTMVTIALQYGLETPCLSAALHFLNGYSNVDSPMHIIQAQRDYFGAHTYIRKETGEIETGGFTK